MKKLTIVKIGGQLIDDEKELSGALSRFTKIEGHKILVHGGGRRTSELSRTLGLTPVLHEGRRITDKATLDVATMVYAGLINKNMVAQLQAMNCPAFGVSGVDGNLILSDKRSRTEIDFGFVGDIRQINTPSLMKLLSMDLVPVFCAITHDGKGQLLNTNADTIASALATALANQLNVTLKYCFEKAGVLDDPKNDLSVLSILTHEEYVERKVSGKISDGMIPKLDNAFHAKRHNVNQVTICGIDGIVEQKGTEICL